MFRNLEDVTIKSIVLYLSFLLGSLGSRGASGGFFPLSARFVSGTFWIYLRVLCPRLTVCLIEDPIRLPCVL